MSPGSRPFNFSAGPAILPPPVYAEAAEAVRELRKDGHTADEGCGLSILEISHRSADYSTIHASAIELCHDVLNIPRTHRVLFLQGGASLQFAMIPLNFHQNGKVATYVDTGVWSDKAIRESQVVGETKVVASSADSGYDHIPDLPAPLPDASYFHITTNNTIYGTEFQKIPDIGGACPLFVDCSSHIGSRPLDFDRVAFGYAGAQKNLGPSGVTLAFIHEDLLASEPEGLPHYLRYSTHAKKPIYNTPNTFGVLVLKLVLEWLRDQGGLNAMETANRGKADALYHLLDGSELYRPRAQAGHRSLMNVVWTLAGKDDAEIQARTERFLAEASGAGFSGLKGHRLAGGCRASIYNAFPQEGVDALVQFMADFERRVG